MVESPKDGSESLARTISKNLASRDRNAKAELVRRRRAAGLMQLEIDEALGLPDGSTQELEAYDSDPSASELRHYEAYIILTEELNRQEELSHLSSIREDGSADAFEPRVGMKFLRRGIPNRLWTVSAVLEDGVELEATGFSCSLDELELPPVLPSMRVRFLAGGDAVWHVESVTGDWVRIRGWQNSPPFRLDEFWKRFDLLDDHLSDRKAPSQELGGLDSSIPTDEEILEIHSDGNLWAEPEDQRARFLRWLRDHDAHVYADARREIEEELGVEAAESEDEAEAEASEEGSEEGAAAWMATKGDNLVSLIDPGDSHTRQILRNAGYDLVPLYRKG